MRQVKTISVGKESSTGEALVGVAQWIECWTALAGVAQWIECRTAKQRLAGLIPSHAWVAGQVPSGGHARGKEVTMH